MNIDLESAACKKLGKNIKKYPIEKCKGSMEKYTELLNPRRQPIKTS